MYNTNIANSELQYFHNRPVHNFTAKLTDVLSSDLFKVEEVITDSIYKIYPLFYTIEITSTNPNDKILENKVIICQKLEKETMLTFKSSDGEVTDFSDYGTYYPIGHNLSDAEFNGYVSLLRHSVTHNEDLTIADTVKGVYGTYEFDIDGATVIDTGFVITDETIASEPKVRLSENVFRWSTYTLKLTILHYTGVNILDDTTPSDFIVKDTLEIELTPNTWVDIPVSELEQDYIISIDATVEIRHDKPEIHMISGLTLETEPQTVQIGETSDITAQLLDYDGEAYNLNDASGRTVHFYEVLTPTITLSATKNVIQTSETTDINAKVKDEDGSIVKNAKVHFYKEE